MVGLITAYQEIYGTGKQLLDGEIYAGFSKLNERISAIIMSDWSSKNKDIWESLTDETLEKFVTWHNIQSLAKFLEGKFDIFGAWEGFDAFKAEHPDDFYVLPTKNSFPHMVEWLKLDNEILRKLASGEEKLIRNHGGNFIFGRELARNAFNDRLKMLYLKQFVVTFCDAAVESYYSPSNLVSVISLVNLYLREKFPDHFAQRMVPAPVVLLDESAVSTNPSLFFSAAPSQQIWFLKSLGGGFDPIQMSEAQVGGISFSNCVEVSVLNAIFAAFTSKEDGTLVLPTDKLRQPLKGYFDTKKDFSHHASSHSEWAEIVSGLPGVKYVKKTSESKGVEIRAGVISVLNILTHFFFEGTEPLEFLIDQSPLEERLRLLQTKFQEINSHIQLSFEEDTLFWNHRSGDYVGNILLEREKGSKGKLALQEAHGEFSWNQKSPPVISQLINFAKTDESLLLIAYAVNNGEIFHHYWDKLLRLNVKENKWMHHISQMDLRTNAMQALVFGSLCPSPMYDRLCLAIAYRGVDTFPRSLLLNMKFLEKASPPPSPKVLSRLPSIAPNLLANGGGKLFQFYLKTGKRALISDDVLSKLEIIDSYMFAGHVDVLESMVTRMTNVSTVFLYLVEAIEPILNSLKTINGLDKINRYFGELTPAIVPFIFEMHNLETLHLLVPSLYGINIRRIIRHFFAHLKKNPYEDSQELIVRLPLDDFSMDEVGELLGPDPKGVLIIEDMRSGRVVTFPTPAS